jgi:hypothetical protein
LIIVLAGFPWIATFGVVVGADLSTQRDTVAAWQFKHYSICFTKELQEHIEKLRSQTHF